MDFVLVGTPLEYRENPIGIHIWNDVIFKDVLELLQIFPDFTFYQDSQFVSETSLQPPGFGHPGTLVELGKLEGRRCVRKQFCKLQLDQLSQLRLQREICIPILFSHPNIGRVLGIRENIEYVDLYLEYYEGGDLFSYVQDQPDCRLSLDQIQKVGKQLIDTVAFLHDRNIIHRDLKLENLFLTANSDLRVGDFGYCTVFTENGSPIGTPRYASPEIIKDQVCRGSASDAWSVGVILFIMYHGRFPFPSSETDEQLQEVEEGAPISPRCPRRLRKILKGLLNPNPQRRMTLRKCQRSKFWKIK